MTRIVQLYPTGNMVSRLTELRQLFWVNRRHTGRIYSLRLAVRRRVLVSSARTMLLDNLGLRWQKPE